MNQRLAALLDKPLKIFVKMVEKKLDGRSQRRLAETSGVSQSKLSRILSCQAEPDLSEIFAIAKALACEPIDLIQDSFALGGQKIVDSNIEQGAQKKTQPKARTNAQARAQQGLAHSDEKKKRGADAEKDLHVLSSEIAAQIVTALEPRLIPANLQKEKQELLALIIGCDDDEAIARATRAIKFPAADFPSGNNGERGSGALG